MKNAFYVHFIQSTSFKVSLMHCKNGEKLKNFYENLFHIKGSQSFDIILDDLSISVLKINNQILQVLPSYKHVVHCWTMRLFENRYCKTWMSRILT